MNVNEGKFSSDQDAPAGGRSRRRFLRCCVGLLGALLGAPLGQWRPGAPATAGRRSARTAGPRERALCEADFYRSHQLAG